MRIGRVVFNRLLWCAALGVIMVGSIPALGQDEADCAAGELALLAPQLELPTLSDPDSDYRFGVVLQWDLLPDEETTCSVIVDSASFGVDLELAGAYAGDVDRVFRFSVSEDGYAGSLVDNALWLDWTNSYVTSGGSFDGIINLSATGGLHSHSLGDNTWSDANDGFPVYHKYLDILALAVSPTDADHLLASMGTTGSLSPSSGWRGLWEKHSTGGWTRIAEDWFPDNVPITDIAFSPDGTSFIVGTGTSFLHEGGFYVTDDGVNFREFSHDLDPEISTNPNVQALAWMSDGKIYAAVQVFGIYRSDDDGQSFERVSDPGITLVGAIVESRQDSAVLVGGNGDFVASSVDGGETWTSLRGDLGLASPVTCLTVDPDDSDVILIGTDFSGLWRTANRGLNWVRVAASLVSDDPGHGRAPEVCDVGFLHAESTSGVVAAGVGVGLIRSTDDALSWALTSSIFNTNCSCLGLSANDVDQVFLGTYGGGVFRPEDFVPLSETVVPSSMYPEFNDIELGLSLRVGDGSFVGGSTFRVISQDFQGYIVWRAKGTDPNARVAIGVFDKTNPESCYESYCGFENYNITLNCFSERRAACFDFSTPGKGAFFDDNVFNGFEYLYAVGTFDYGNTASVEDPHGLSAAMLVSDFDAGTDMVSFQVNVDAADAVSTLRPYAYPNPLRRGVGMPSNLGEEVVFTNLPPGAEIIVFSLEGTEVAFLNAEDQVGANHFWITRDTESNELLASGVYIWKLMAPERDDYFDKIVIIR